MGAEKHKFLKNERCLFSRGGLERGKRFDAARKIRIVIIDGLALFTLARVCPAKRD
jgi:hypothetical protein